MPDVKWRCGHEWSGTIDEPCPACLAGGRTSVPALTVGQLVIRSHEYAVRQGFWPGGGRNFGEAIALCMSELSEALEAFRTNQSPAHVAEELADCMIRIGDLAGGFKYDLTRALLEKMAYNETQRPFKHGKEF
jgi:NTP pyrophosphatase (non-canonical NTP hydrolase)